jgi:hypothetical protein
MSAKNDMEPLSLLRRVTASNFSAHRVMTHACVSSMRANEAQ